MGALNPYNLCGRLRQVVVKPKHQINDFNVLQLQWQKNTSKHSEKQCLRDIYIYIIPLSMSGALLTAILKAAADDMMPFIPTHNFLSSKLLQDKEINGLPFGCILPNSSQV